MTQKQLKKHPQQSKPTRATIEKRIAILEALMAQKTNEVYDLKALNFETHKKLYLAEEKLRQIAIHAEKIGEIGRISCV